MWQMQTAALYSWEYHCTIQVSALPFPTRMTANSALLFPALTAQVVPILLPAQIREDRLHAPITEMYGTRARALARPHLPHAIPICNSFASARVVRGIQAHAPAPAVVAHRLRAHK